MRQSAQVIPFTYAWSNPVRPEFARVSVMYPPAAMVQLGPRPVLSLRLKLSKKSTVPPAGGGPTPPSGVPPSGGGGGGGGGGDGGGAPGLGAWPKTITAFPALFVSRVFPKTHGTFTVDTGSVSNAAGYPLKLTLESTVISALTDPPCSVR